MKLLQHTSSCLFSPGLQNSQHAFVAIASLIAEAAYAPVIASIHIYNTLFGNIHDATVIVDNLLITYQPRIYQIVEKLCVLL